MNCEILTKPSGLIRIFLAVLSAISLASILDFGGSFEFALHCTEGTEIVSIHKTVKWKYPFRLTSVKVPVLSCNETGGEPSSWEKVFFIDFHDQAKFFGFMGGTSSFLSSIWLIMACFRQYDTDATLAMTDTVLSVSAGLLWLCANCAWASAVMTLKSVTSVQQVQRLVLGLPACQSYPPCEVTDKKDEFGKAVFSVIVGFFCCALYFSIAFLASQEHRRVNIERRRLIGNTRSSQQPPSYYQSGSIQADPQFS